VARIEDWEIPVDGARAIKDAAFGVAVWNMGRLMVGLVLDAEVVLAKGSVLDTGDGLSTGVVVVEPSFSLLLSLLNTLVGLVGFVGFDGVVGLIVGLAGLLVPVGLLGPFVGLVGVGFAEPFLSFVLSWTECFGLARRCFGLLLLLVFAGSSITDQIVCLSTLGVTLLAGGSGAAVLALAVIGLITVVGLLTAAFVGEVTALLPLLLLDRLWFEKGETVTVVTGLLELLLILLLLLLLLAEAASAANSSSSCFCCCCRRNGDCTGRMLDKYDGVDIFLPPMPIAFLLR